MIPRLQKYHESLWRIDTDQRGRIWKSMGKPALRHVKYNSINLGHINGSISILFLHSIICNIAKAILKLLILLRQFISFFRDIVIFVVCYLSKITAFSEKLWEGSIADYNNSSPSIDKHCSVKNKTWSSPSVKTAYWGPLDTLQLLGATSESQVTGEHQR